MKKLLLATAAFALLAPAAHAEIKLDLGGYFKGYAGYGDQDTAGSRSLDLKRKSQVFFTGETTLDNGLTVGYNGQLIADTTVDPNVGNPNPGEDSKFEQSYLYFSGNWGRVNLGKENGAAYLLQVAAPGADSNLDGMDIDFSFFNQGTANIRQDYAQTGARTSAGGRGEDFQYADKITYLTPKFNGFQAGVSYTPDVDAKDTNDYFGMASDVTPGGFEHLIDGGVRYDGEYAGVGIHAGGGYTHADLEANSLAVAGPTDNYDEWNAGLKFTWDSWGFGGAYNSRDNAVATNGDTDTWVLGADYTYGAYTFGASYLNSDGDQTAAVGDSEYDRWTLGAGYTFGPGMKFNGSVAFHDLDAGAAVGGDNQATVVAIGTDVQF